MVNVFSFCLYGPENPRYYPGMLENVYLAAKYFPTWKVYVYYAPDVTEGMVNTLRTCSSVVMRPTGIFGEPNMIQRFFAIDEPDVELMMVRDADSRIHWKDRWAIRDFLSRPELIAHTIRDHVEHTAPLMGGLWGLRKSSGINLQGTYENYREDKSLGHRLAHDQNFLLDVIYPAVVPKLLVHYSFNRDPRDRHCVKFPFEWSPEVFCGKTENAFHDTNEPPKKRWSLPEARIRLQDSPQSSPQPVQQEIRVIPPQSSNIQLLNFIRRK
jgi:hypothetical protein